MDDLINRQAVLEMAYDMSEIDGEHFTEPCMVVDVEDIQKLPPVKQEPKWIPVSERLPLLRGLYKVSDDVLITNGYENDMGYLVRRKVKTFWHYYGSDIEVGINDKDNDAIAWMPLPKPYKPQESEG